MPPTAANAANAGKHRARRLRNVIPGTIIRYGVYSSTMYIPYIHYRYGTNIRYQVFHELVLWMLSWRIHDTVSLYTMVLQWVLTV